MVLAVSESTSGLDCSLNAFQRPGSGSFYENLNASLFSTFYYLYKFYPKQILFPHPQRPVITLSSEIIIPFLLILSNDFKTSSLQF